MVLKQGEVFCVSDRDYNRIQNKRFDLDLVTALSYAEIDPIVMLAEYAAHESTDAKCGFATDDNSNDFFKYQSGAKVDNDKRAYVCPMGTLDIMTRRILDKQKQDEEKQQQAEKAKKLKALKENPKVRPAIRKGFKDSCAKTLNDGRVQMNQNYVSSVCECLACIYDEFHGVDVAYDFIQNGAEDSQLGILGMMISDRHSSQCGQYYLKESSFDPCKWAKDFEK